MARGPVLRTLATGDEFHMAFNFPLMAAHASWRFARGQLPIVDIMRATRRKFRRRANGRSFSAITTS